MFIAYIGKILREHFPQLYKRITRFITNTKRNNYIFISDSLGGSFKDYISANVMSEKLKNLKLHLDKYSQITIDVIYQRILNYPEERYKQILVPQKDNIVGGLLEEEKIEFNSKKIKKEQKINFKTNLMETSVFKFYHGITFLPENVQKFINEKDFIDIGAYIGDSAVALRKYNYKKNLFN